MHDASGAQRVLVVEDEPHIVEVIETALRFRGFDVDAAGTGAEAMDRIAEKRPDLLLLDVMLPDVEGFDIARRLAKTGSRTPIIFLTARGHPSDKVRGLTVGGDDYMTKPFSVDELFARVANVLRRADTRTAGRMLRFEDLMLDNDTRIITRAGEEVELTETEHRLLRYLMTNPRRALSRRELLDHVWRYDFNGDSRILETYVSYLRRKIHPHGPPLIQTVRGFGYALRAPRA